MCYETEGRGADKFLDDTIYDLTETDLVDFVNRSKLEEANKAARKNETLYGQNISFRNLSIWTYLIWRDTWILEDKEYKQLWLLSK